MSRQLYLNFIKDNRWKYIVNGLGTTLQITFFAVILGIALGFLIAVIRSTYDKTGKGKILNFLAKVYLTVIRGTPVLVQLLIIYFVVFASVDINKIIVAVMAFGINSGAYVAEIIRSGIMSIDDGQFEAGRSLGFNYTQTMIYIILPQALKNVLPALANEFIVYRLRLLTHHLGKCRLCRLWIIFGMRISQGTFRRHILKIRKININQASQLF